jgi:hypothetical protein
MALPDAEGRARTTEPEEPGAGPEAALSPEHIMDSGGRFRPTRSTPQASTEVPNRLWRSRLSRLDPRPAHYE